MDNYAAFKTLLDNDGIRYKESSFDDGDRFIYIPQKIKNGALLNVIVTFSEMRIKLLVLGMARIEDKDKQVKCYEFFNTFNKDYAFFKMYLQEDNVCLESDFSTVVVEGEFQPKALMGYIAAALNVVQEVYKDIMKIQLS